MERVFLLWRDGSCCGDCGECDREIERASKTRPEFGPPLPRTGWWNGLWAYQSADEELIGGIDWYDPWRRWVEEVEVVER